MSQPHTPVRETIGKITNRELMTSQCACVYVVNFPLPIISGRGRINLRDRERMVCHNVDAVISSNSPCGPFYSIHVFY